MPLDSHTMDDSSIHKMKNAHKTQSLDWKMCRHGDDTRPPETLRIIPLWIGYAIMYCTKKKKYLKKPAEFQNGKVQNRDALKSYNQRPYTQDRAGFMPQGGVVCIDIDLPRDPDNPEVTELRKLILEQFRAVTYVEKSLSNVYDDKDKWHIFVRAKNIKDMKYDAAGIEIFAEGKQAILTTGISLNKREMTEQQKMVDDLVEQLKMINKDDEKKAKEAEKAKGVEQRAGATVNPQANAPATTHTAKPTTTTTPRSATDKDRRDAEAILKAFKDQGIDLCPNNNTFVQVGFALVSILGIDRANDILANESGYDKETRTRLKSMAKKVTSSQIASLVDYAKKRGVKLPSMGSSNQTKKPKIEEKAPAKKETASTMGGENRHNTLRNLIWHMCKQDFTIKAMIEAGEILAESFNEPCEEESVEVLVRKSAEKDQGERGKVDRFRVCYQPDDRESVEFKSIADSLGIEIRYNLLAEKYQLRRDGKKWLDAHNKIVLANLRKRLRSEVYAYPVYKNKVAESPKKLTKLSSKAHAELLFETVADDNQVDPFLEEMKEIWAWGEEKFPNGISDSDRKGETFLESVFSVPSEYVRIARWIFPAMIRAMIYRSRRPGYKFDYVLTYCGRSGIGKSEIGLVIFKSIGVDPLEFFTDSVSLDHKNKEMVENLIGFKLIELSDMKGQKHADSDTTKSFISRPADRARLAYDRGRSDIPRRFVITATADRPNFLAISDDDRGRRWIVVRLKRHPMAKTDDQQVERLRQHASDVMKQIFYEQMLRIVADEGCLMPWELVMENETNLRRNRITNHDLNTRLIDVIEQLGETFSAGDLAEELEAAPQSKEMQQVTHILENWGFKKRKDQRRDSKNYGKHVWQVVDSEKFEAAAAALEGDDEFE